MRVRGLVKSTFLFFFDVFGVNCFLRKRAKTPIVLFWHGVSTHPNQHIEGESFSVDLFEKQIRYVMRYNEVISIDEFYYRYTNCCFTNKEVVITFDDGYKDNLTVAAPILKKYGLPFTVFISALNITEQKRFYISIPRIVIIGGELDCVEIQSMNYKRKLTSKQDRILCAHEIEYKIKYLTHDVAKTIASELVEYIGKWKFDELCTKYTNGTLLTWDDVRKLIKDYNCTIGSHCLDHCICHPNQPLGEVEKQLVDSKILITRETGIKCNYFAYPNGDFTEATNELVSNNYLMGFSTLPVSVYSNLTNINCIGRVGVPRNMNEFKYFLSRIILRNI